VAGSRHLESGFTLLELIVVLAIAAILAVIAVPGFDRLLGDNRLASTYNEILAGVRYARSTAITRHTEVSMVLEVTGSQSWQLFVRETDAGDENPLLTRIGSLNGLSMSGRRVTFNELGALTDCGDQSKSCEFVVTNKATQDSAGFSISTSGGIIAQ